MIPLLNLQGRKLFVLRRKLTAATDPGLVINPRAVWPNADENAPIVGLDEDLEYLPIFTTVRPDFDGDHYSLRQVEGPDGEQWSIAYETLERPKEEVKDQAANYERFEVQKHVSREDFTKTVILTQAAILRQAKGLALTPDEQAAADSLVATAAILTRNAAHLEQLQAAIDAGQKPKLSDGWEPTP